ncbi:MAG: NYN domain-containing protein [Candidatus Puniceispirillaceae bacterium]
MTKVSICEKTVLFIDGSNFYAAARSLGMDIDYARMRAHFAKDAHLIRAYYYTALPEDQEYSPLRPLIDWLDYNGYAVVSKLTREFTDPETGKRRIKGNMDMEIALDMLRLAPQIDHAILFSGDGDFCRLLEDVQGMGVRVTVVSTTKTSPPMVADALRRMADQFIEMESIRDVITRPPRENVETIQTAVE